jgi:hypothetical protein
MRDIDGIEKVVARLKPHMAEIEAPGYIWRLSVRIGADAQPRPKGAGLVCFFMLAL